ncbi:MAG TPA: chitobiase/beta-hexosaminidase C-terminal domain-containing protein [Armatimonadota bacterium]|nr:chitobiase/beta-hexosaminidase C-terminal domain-containing protein [Armatimonadota bacterium]
MSAPAEQGMLPIFHRYRSGVVFATIAFAAMGMAAIPAGAQQLTDLGTLTGPSGFSIGRSINTVGQVTGYSLSSGGNYHAFLWEKNSGMQDLGSFIGKTGYSVGMGINADGQVTGYSTASSGATQAFIWDSAHGMMNLGGLAGPNASSQGAAINAFGDVTGNSKASSGATHAFLWDRQTGMIDLGSLTGLAGLSKGQGINAAGQVTGYSQAPGNATHAFVWDSGVGMVDLGTFTGPTGYSNGEGINVAGEVTGYSTTSRGVYHAFVWDRAHGMTDLGSLAGPLGSSYGVSISDAGQVAGYSQTPSNTTHAFVWDPLHGMTDLGSLTGQGGYSIGLGINAVAQVTGYSLSTSGNYHALVTTPAPAQSDTSAPTTTASLDPGTPDGKNGWYTTPVTVTLTATDPDGADDVAATHYTLDGGTSASYSGPITVSGDAVHNLSFWSVDQAGNTETAHGLTIKIDSAPPVVTASATPTILWPPNGQLVNVTVSGTITDNLSGVNPSSGAFSAVDSYGEPQPGGTFAIASDGSYSFTVPLEASRLGEDKNGRAYTVVVQASDEAGVTGAGSVVISVPHDQRSH